MGAERGHLLLRTMHGGVGGGPHPREEGESRLWEAAALRPQFPSVDLSSVTDFLRSFYAASVMIRTLRL